jgi:tripartite-type tricarboxylate transporter receptor subunit TctC
MPNVPTFPEQGLGSFRGNLWHGLVAARGVPAKVIAKLNADINAVLRRPERVARFTADDVAAAGGTPQQVTEVIRADMERWKIIVKQADIKVN